MTEPGKRLALSDIIETAVYKKNNILSELQIKSQKINSSKQFLDEFITHGGRVYGVTTGLGSSSKNTFSANESKVLQQNLIRYHGCGTGPVLTESQCRAALLLRIHCLAMGYSGIRSELIEHLSEMLKRDVIPWIPSRGSVGASGDLTPLSYIAAAAAGDRYCYFNGEKTPSSVALSQSGLKPWVYEGREALALMNGTSVMTGVASIALLKAIQIDSIACQLTGLLVEIMQGRSAPFYPQIHQLKGHKGQSKVAESIFKLIDNPLARINAQTGGEHEIQDVYSLRCSPQIIGVLRDAIIWADQLILTEANSVNDNPVFIADQELVLNGGNFFGGHIAVACDTLKTTVANVINLADRQLALIMERGMSGYLTENLVSPNAHQKHLHHAFKGIQITMSALSAEIIKRSQPMGIFSRSTESRNQDVVSMGTTAALELDELLSMCQDAMSILAMAVSQSFLILEEKNSMPNLNENATDALKTLRSAFPGIHQDCELDHFITTMKNQLFGNHTKNDI